MASLDAFVLVFVAGLITALATGLGAIPFLLYDEISDRWTVALWGLASGIMVAASLFGLLREGLTYGSSILLVPGMALGIVVVIAGHRVVERFDLDPKQYEQADFDTLVLILGVLTVHSFPEGVAVGVAFGELGLATAETVAIGALAVPTLAVFMTVAISIHNVPEGVAVSIPLRTMGVPGHRMVWWAVFSSLPQPIGAVLAFAFVSLAREFIPFGFGFAAGAMIYLVLAEFVPEAMERGADLAGGGRREFAAGAIVGVVGMVPLALL